MTLSHFLDATQRYDRAHVRDAIRLLPEQCKEATLAAPKLPWAYRGLEHVVVAGMGGSGLGAHVVQTALADHLRVPFTIVNDYALPAFVNRRTLVIASSYSGTTEETLAAYKEAKVRGAKLVVVANSGTLAAMAKRDGVPMVAVSAKYNPSGQPRYGVGSTTFGVLEILRAAHLVRITATEIDRAITALRVTLARIERSATTLDLARTLDTRIPLLIGAEHVAGALHVVQNQIHESAKHIAASFLLPELNHHLLEGLRFPRTNPRMLHAVVFASAQYHPRTQRRVTITRDILAKQRITSTAIALTADTRLGQALETIAHGAYLGLALAMHHRINPAPVPWVAEFKRRLTR